MLSAQEAGRTGRENVGWMLYIRPVFLSAYCGMRKGKKNGKGKEECVLLPELRA